MSEEVVIKGIKKRLYTECELRPSEVLVLKKYIDNLESVLKEIREYTEELQPHWLGNDLVLEILTDIVEIIDKGIGEDNG